MQPLITVDELHVVLPFLDDTLLCFLSSFLLGLYVAKHCLGLTSERDEREHDEDDEESFHIAVWDEGTKKSHSEGVGRSCPD